MKFWHIAVKDLKVRVRDKSAFVVLLIIPMVMIIVLGTVFNWAGSSFTANVALVDLDRGDMARRLTQDVFASPHLKDLLVITAVPSEAEARTLVEQGNTSAAVVIPAGFSEGVSAGTKVSIIVLGNPETATQASVIATFVTYGTSMIAGSWWPIDVAPPFMQQPARAFPQYWAVNGLNKIIVRGLGFAAITPNLLVLTVAGITFLLAGSAIYVRRVRS